MAMLNNSRGYIYTVYIMIIFSLKLRLNLPRPIIRYHPYNIPNQLDR